MREIKFKAWDNENKAIVYQDDEQYMIELSADGLYLSTIYEGAKQTTCYHIHDAKFMQYTGLKDKNGKEIYEGDIVYIWHEDYPEEKTIGKVAYNLGGEYPAFEIYVYTGRGNLKYESYHEEYNSFSCPEHIIEVIGNIYENPELLEAEK